MFKVCAILGYSRAVALALVLAGCESHQTKIDRASEGLRRVGGSIPSVTVPPNT